jgi:simple sugar transport system substrate-binding protein
MVALGAIDAALPARQTSSIDAARQALLEGRIGIFAAPLVDNQGRTRLAKGSLNDPQIAGMDWLVQGVAGSMPAH